MKSPLSEQPNGRRAAVTPGRLHLLCVAIALASAGLSLGALAADALPQGGNVISGSGSISQSGSDMTVNTNTARTAINWQRFNVGPDNRITFNQPDGKSVTLNRVIGGDPSKIYGAVTSNGQLILVNPNGVWIGPKAHISSSALVASAGFLTEEQARQFAETGKLDIQLTGNVTNLGRITVHDNGMVALLGAQVNNAGVIQARKGMVQLATGPQATLDFHGDGLLNIAVGGTPGEQDSVNADVTGGVHHTGEIDVGNGVVAMSADRAAKHLDSVINVGGNVVADSVSEQGGSIVLGNSAKTNVTGSLSATGTSGGSVKVLGDEVNVAGSARIDASGTQGAGGQVLVGGSFQGQGPEQAAKSTNVAQGAQLKADGKTDGGQVVVWSDGSTHFAGSASAQGGQKGGVIETSGKQLTVAPEAQVNAGGGQQSGKWLLDPETVTVTADGSGAGTVSASVIADSLKSGDVEINASKRINVDSAIVAQDAGFHTLKLMANGTAAPVSAYNDTGDPFADAKRNDSGSVYINAPILLKDGHLYIVATGDVMLNNTTGTQAGDQGYLGRAIIDVGTGTIWIKTSNSASVIQQSGTALIGENVAVEGSSVLLDSPLNFAGTLAGKASNGKFIYNQTSADGVNTGQVKITQDGLTQSMDGVKSENLSKVGEQWVWERNGTLTHHLTIDEKTEFQYLVFESLEYVNHKTGAPFPDDNSDSDYWVKSLTFTNPSTNEVWVISTNAAGQISVTRNGTPTNELPAGFSFSTNQGQVTTSSKGFGVQGGTGDRSGNVNPDAINRNGSTGASDQLVVDLGSSTTAVDADLEGLSHNGNHYESGVISFLSGKDTSQSGGVTLKSQTAQLNGKIADAERDYGAENPEMHTEGRLTAGGSENSQAVKGVDDFVDRQLNQDRFAAKVTPSTEADTRSNVGDYRVDGKLEANDFVNRRYQVSLQSGTLTVNPAQLTVTADPQEKTYGDADPKFTYKVDGLKNDDTQDKVLNNGALTRDPGENVGLYDILQGGLGLTNDQGRNYVLTFVKGQLSITPASLTLIPDDTGKVYGDVDPKLTFDISGLKNGDSIADVINGGSLTREAGEDVRQGGYAIYQGDLGLNSGKGANYILTYQAGTFTITPATLVVSAEDKSKVYGEIDPELTYRVSGLKGNDTEASVLNGGSLTREAGENVKPGGYAIGQGSLGLNSQNYLLQFEDGTFTITPATLTLDANDHTKIYGEVDPKLTYRLSGLKNGETPESVLNGGSLERAPGENVGNYRIGQGDLGLNGEMGQNYILTFNAGKMAITPAELVVTADHKTKVYGDADPELTYSYHGLKNGDSAAGVLNGGSLSREAGENVRAGGYAINQGDLRLLSGNYTLVFKNGQLDVTPAPLEISADNKSKAQGKKDPRLTWSASGLKNGDTAAVAKGSLVRAPGEEEGTYSITQGQAFSAGGNYTVTFRDGTLTITGPLAPVAPDVPLTLPMTAQSPGNTRCTALESPSAASANYSVSPAVVRSYAVQLVCKPRSYEGKTSTTPDINDVLTYANSLIKNGYFVVPEGNRSVIPHDLKPTSKGGK
ncbi:filamentous hemagglutinin N-terminal domain-containing protein [Pseudomonas sp. ZM23]|uniref:MBG domain-containing protein n=1 Tax=Pseudomonas triclosanedens TaxID=2961893 RepID=A0ABY6ZRU4_9PSED|nr:MBG domain-containing protein [Pseudomonas triclosanedens]MCP8467047.1 filamentous hemagglutinin N-terminal domain-containing protein [Pseudomonas triclosanedens]MCP8472805.1 filamentous hemagglutinin N-terminal domain-containing protein [Pseudomonas triclosanedens]MCP8478236.1 filamentous hemagglutinin N-terminal domain-containing protein [Pseudomonas triclosanedens]WAI47642.1 MBG domain-containing protein [Pseudomonas triclosanedens]